MAVNKCNISSYILTELDNLRRGRYCNDNTKIYDNYIDYLACDTIERVTCFPDNCFNPTIVVVCTLNVVKISYTIQENTLSCFVADDDINAAKSGIKYEWTFDEEVFILVSGKYSPNLVVVLQTGKTFAAVVTPIQVRVEDSGECVYVKTCYLTPAGMVCTENYVVCSNPIGLTVTNKFVQCASPIGLTVSKKA